MTNVVVQSDNAVVDYTTIQSLIDAVNSLSAEVDQLKVDNQAITTKVNADGTTSQVASGKQIIDSGNVPIPTSGKTVTVKFNKTFSAKPDVTAIVMFASKAIVPFIASSADLTLSSVTFSLSEDPGGAKGGTSRIYWIAVGKSA
jgi:hypothetical protein